MEWTDHGDVHVLDRARTKGLIAHEDASANVRAVVEAVRPLGRELDRSCEVHVHGRLKFRVKQLVYVAFSLDQSVMGFAFPREERDGLVASDPRTFRLPTESELRFNWVHADLAVLDPTEARELVVDAWRMVVPKKLSLAYDLVHPDGPGRALETAQSSSASTSAEA